MSIQSIEAFKKQLANGEYKSTQLKIYRSLVDGPKNLDELRSTMGIAHQTLTSALSRLMDLGVVGQSATGSFYRTGVNTWEDNAVKREQERQQKWLKLGEKNGWAQMLIEIAVTMHEQRKENEAK